MIKTLSKNQNWAKATPILGMIFGFMIFWFFKPSQTMFWALINIPLYLFHQTEEHLWPGGFKNYINKVINKLPDGKEILTDEKIFWINILLVWIAFLIFGALSFLNLGFGLLIIIFSIINCFTHIVTGIKHREWNPGLVVASFQFSISIYAAYFISANGLGNVVFWWISTVIFSILIHVILFNIALKK